MQNFDNNILNAGQTPWDDKFHEECAVFGIAFSDEASKLAVLGLHAMQHRGQEATGILSSDGKKFHVHRAMGMVGDVFSDPNIVNRLEGKLALGHNRYSTTGNTTLANIQPMFADMETGGLAIAHNGNFTNALTLRKSLIQEGAIFQSTSDTEILLHLASRASGTVEQRLIDGLTQLEGAYSIVALTENNLIGVRDPYGVRPLLLGQLGGSYILASESCAFDIMGAKHIRDIEPGEMVTIGLGGISSQFPFANKPSKFCIFEYIYFSRPDSLINNQPVYEIRKNIGRELMKQAKIDADLVVPVPDSGIPSALGYAEASGIPFDYGIIRNHYIGRTFIEPSDEIRHLGVKLKHNANRGILNDKSIVLVDDSIVRGTTSKKIVEMLRMAGVRKIHMLIASPPTTHSCFYGVDTPERSELLAAQHDIATMIKLLGVDSLQFITMDGLYKAVSNTVRDNDNPQFCDACFSGDYPITVKDNEAGVDKQLSLLSSHSPR